MYIKLTVVAELDDTSDLDDIDKYVEGVADYAEALIIAVEKVENWEINSEAC